MSGSSQRLRIRTDADATRSLILASSFAGKLGFSKGDCSVISTAVSELARNILKYAGSGEIVLEKLEGEGGGVQVTARDQGPGIEDVDRAMEDHYSSSGTLGLGLPGVKRMMDEFSLDSEIGKGTRVVIRKWKNPRRRPVRSVLLGSAATRTVESAQKTSGQASTPPVTNAAQHQPVVDIAFFVRPCRGERVSGDLGVIERRGSYLLLAIVDALGHGVKAHEIAKRATSFLKKSWESDPVRTMIALHEDLGGTDGAAAGLCVVDVPRRMVRYAGVGNTVIRVVGAQGKRLFSSPGTLGHQIRSPREQTMSLGKEEIVMLYTDGVRENFEIEEYPQLRYQEARIAARGVVKRFGKDYDDASCIVMRYDV